MSRLQKSGDIGAGWRISRRRSRGCLWLLGLSIGAQIVSAQTPITPMSQFVVEIPAPDAATAQAYIWKLYTDGATTGVVLPGMTCVAGMPTGTQTCRALVPAASPGVHTAALSASNATGESTRSNTVAYVVPVVATAPGNPFGLRIVDPVPTPPPSTNVGVWTNVTPPQVPTGGAGGNNCDYGTLSVVVDPTMPTTVYLGTCEHGILKSQDSGSTWTHVNTGANGDVLDRTRQWTLAIDPVNPQILYTNSGYGGGDTNGAWKTTDGGVNWSRIWPPLTPGPLSNIVQQNFVAQVFLDPTDHLHVFLSWHGRCAAPYTPVCYGESRDGGATWTMRNGDTRWVESEAQTIYILDGQKWLFANHADGLWSTDDAGVTWTLVNANGAGHWPAQLYKSNVGAYYIGSDVGVFRSATGTLPWTLVMNGYLTNGLIGDGTTIFASNAGSLTPWVPVGTNPYMMAAEATGTTWSPVPWAVPTGQWTQGAGAGMAYDRQNHFLYSSNGTVGLWRVRTQ